jgi:hypothetical protein
MTVGVRNQICCGLCLLGSTLSIRAMTCLCFFHAVYAPATVSFFVFPQEITLAEEIPPEKNRPILTFDIFHPPRA